ncbi:nucleotide sugar epimerase/dehydratase WbpM [Devosia pacifica]|uniref:Nucleotide sugar epimerase/dehydratase WbpM n=1 Tax=Devosia pacifica TaxID=1335967 RepID=A0A918VWX6_9HYPH|nr:nucleoside-diphosphate sugar epimerase/dehydratase [Devosia pacifica]GHA32647.1 nucleotide sugar epimerase/dehydratase WbpM [Devosia pacifica]
MVDRIRSFFERLTRPQKRMLQVAFDCLALLLVVWCAYSLRLGTLFQPNGWQLFFMLLAPVLAIPFFVRLGLYRAILRYLPDKALWTVLKAMSAAAIGWMALIFLAEMSGAEGVPRSIPVIYWALGTVVIAGSRFAAKAFFAGPVPAAGQRRALIYGAGRSGTQLAIALDAAGDRSVVGFVDDDLSLRGQDLVGRRVYRAEDLAQLIANFDITDIILSIPSASSQRRLEISTRLAELPVRLSTLPSISDLAAGKYTISQLKEIDIEDLLGRSHVAPDPALMQTVVAGKTILITGAGGSIGSQLARLVATNGPKVLIILEASEFALYEIDRKLRGLMPDLEIIPLLGSVIDAKRIAGIFAQWPVEVVFHAAAYKHVPLVEANVVEGVRNNVLGTKIVAEAALEAGVERFVLISTDKAVRPSSIMGATKRISELIIRKLSDRSEADGKPQRFLAVRFGNVLGSTGSVVPLFKEQIAKGGPITLTDHRMTRYFMAISEAAELIVQAAALSDGGEIFLLDMGEPVAIRDLAENMVRLAGLSVRSEDNPTGDIEIRETGIRPGEKLSESLYYDPASAAATQHPKIFKAKRLGARETQLDPLLEQIGILVGEGNDQALRALIEEFLDISGSSERVDTNAAPAVIN